LDGARSEYLPGGPETIVTPLPYGDIGPQRFLRHEFDLLGSRDVIGHVTIGLDTCGFLLVVYLNQASILHRYGDIAFQR